MAKKPNLTCVHGFIHGRAVGIDESEGEPRVVPGRNIRMRAEDVVVYASSEPGTLEVWMAKAAPGPEDLDFQIIGTIEEMDKAMARSALRET